jgi:hypothetical protein
MESVHRTLCNDSLQNKIERTFQKVRHTGKNIRHNNITYIL